MPANFPVPEQPIPDEPVDIYIVGLGIVHPHQVTREVEAAICRSNEVLFVECSEALEAYLKEISPKTTDLHKAAYREGGDRLRAYDIMSAMVIDAAMDHPPVTFALYGHPLIFAYPPFQIMQVAPALGLRVKVLPGVSSLDCLFIDLKLDPAQQGLQMYEATDLLLRQRPLQPDVPALIWQIGAVETRFYSETSSKPERFTRTKEYLLRFYPPDHEVIAVYSSSHPLLKSTMVVFKIEDIEANAEFLHQGMTLYVPPTHKRPVADVGLKEETDSLLHLQQMTVPLDAEPPAAVAG